jgi:hypothetical protein
MKAINIMKKTFNSYHDVLEQVRNMRKIVELGRYKSFINESLKKRDITDEEYKDEVTKFRDFVYGATEFYNKIQLNVDNINWNGKIDGKIDFSFNVDKNTDNTKCNITISESFQLDEKNLSILTNLYTYFADQFAPYWLENELYSTQVSDENI